MQESSDFEISLPGRLARLVVFLRSALEAGLFLRAVDPPSLEDFVLRGHFWPFNEAMALASSS